MRAMPWILASLSSLQTIGEFMAGGSISSLVQATCGAKCLVLKHLGEGSVGSVTWLQWGGQMEYVVQVCSSKFKSFKSLVASNKMFVDLRIAEHLQLFFSARSLHPCPTCPTNKFSQRLEVSRQHHPSTIPAPPARQEGRTNSAATAMKKSPQDTFEKTWNIKDTLFYCIRLSLLRPTTSTYACLIIFGFCCNTGIFIWCQFISKWCVHAVLCSAFQAASGGSSLVTTPPGLEHFCNAQSQWQGR